MIINLLITTFLFAPVVSADESPNITGISINPTKVIPGDVMKIYANISDSVGVVSVQVDMGGIETVTLQLISGTIYNGTWAGSWKVHDTEPKKYNAKITAKNRLGFTSSSTAEWSDPISTYDFNSGAGTDKWAYGYEVLNIRQCSDTFPNEEIEQSKYNQIARDDNNYFDSGAPTTWFYEAAIRYKIKLKENALDITNITVLWKGYGSTPRNVRLYIWNYDSSSYELLEKNGGENEFTLSGSINSDIPNYISPGGNLTFLTYFADSRDSFYTDYVKAEIVYTYTLVTPLITKHPSWSNQYQNPSSIFKNEDITLQAEWDDPNGLESAMLMTDGYGYWREVSTVDLGGTQDQSSFTLTVNNFSNWYVGDIGWKIGGYNTSGGYNETDVMEFELWGNSSVSWISPPPSFVSPYDIGSEIELKARVMDVVYIPGLIGNYYDNMNFTGLDTKKIDPNIEFYFGTGSPSDTNITDPDTFSIIWTGKLYVPHTGNVTFYTEADDWARLVIDNTLVTENMFDGKAIEESEGTIYLTEGFHDIVVLYYEDTGYARIKVSWGSSTINKKVIPPENLFHSINTPIKGYPVEFSWYNDTENVYLGKGISDDNGHATYIWDTSSPELSEGAYHVNASIEDNSSLYCYVTEDNIAESTVYIYNSTIDATLRGRRWFGSGLIAPGEGGSDWASVNFTGGRTLINPEIPGLYNLSVYLEINGIGMDTEGKQVGPFFLTYNVPDLRFFDIEALPALAIELILTLIAYLAIEAPWPFNLLPIPWDTNMPVLYIAAGIWVDDNILAGGLGITNLVEFIIPVHGIEGLTLWGGSTATEDEPFLRWLANTGFANEMEDLPNKYPSPSIIEFSSQLIIMVTEILRDLNDYTLKGLIPFLLWLIDIDSYVPAIKQFVDPDMIGGIIVGNIIITIIEIVRYLVLDFVHFSEIAVQNHPGDIVYLMNATADRLPDILGDSSGTTGLTYIMNNTLRVPRPIIQDLVDEILRLIDWVGHWLPSIFDLLEGFTW